MSPIPFPVDESDVVYLQHQWDDLLSPYPSDKSVKDNSFQKLIEKYSEQGRFYHNLSHIKSLLNLLESFHGKIQNPHAIIFSIWFHDVVYNPERNDNEEESASLASETLEELHVNRETIQCVKDLILATKTHRADNLSGDEQLFLDMDLAILGMGEETYKKYSQAIRQEYSWVPEPTYRISRKKILASFIDRESIYFTDEMKKRFENQARKNISDEIKSLGSQF